jgi:Ca2+-binding RTX toxin-like protein
MQSKMIESLESRRLLSASAFVDGSGTLMVHGDDSGDMIYVNQLPDGSVGVSIYTAADPVNPVVNGVFANAKAVKIFGGAGNDQISFSGQTVATSIDGGSGNDNISVFDQGALGSSVQGGSGNDVILVDNSHFDENFNLVAGTALTSVDGGSGDDAIQVLDGSKAVVTAGSGNDNILVAGTDGQMAFATVSGGSGDDGLVAINANVIYDGGSGNDSLIALNSSGSYAGGSGTDSLISAGSTITTSKVESVA